MYLTVYIAYTPAFRCLLWNKALVSEIIPDGILTHSMYVQCCVHLTSC